MDLFGRLKHMIGVPLAAVVLAGCVGGIILILSGIHPLEAYTALFEGALGSVPAIARTLEKATPLVFSGLAIAFAFKAGLFNIGAQGQLLFGALTAAIVGCMMKDLPAFLHIGLALSAGALAGGAYSAVQGVLKAYTGAHEVITGIMLNYVAINITDVLTVGPFRDTTPGNIIARTPLIAETSKIPLACGLPLGFGIAVAASVIIWWFLKSTPLGFEIRTMGLNADAARYAGMRPRRIIVTTMLISGLLAGSGGAIETLGVVHRYQPGFNVGLGFDGITIALLGKVHPLGVVPAALLMGAMKAGATQMQFSSGVAKELVDVIQAFILLFVAADIFIRKLFRTKTADGTTVRLSSGWGREHAS